MDLFSRYRGLVLPVGIMCCLAVILVPLPPAMMDLLLAANITIGVIVLLTTIHIATPLEFSVFPSLLLATTLSRLVLNVATTRLILTSAETDGMNAAGGVIRSFGEFVAGDRIEVGIIIFIILVVIQFVVITKGATRISEVAARFALDGMPGRQMAIDADVNAGLIDENEAHRRREDIRAQADFYGAMDGASKFVRGDAIASVIITVVNILGGLYVGIVLAGMPISEAGALFTKLTIGDGLVSQVPALLISLAAGLLVTRSATKTNLPEQFMEQLLGNTRALAIAGVFLLLMMVTNLPTIPLAVLGAGCISMAIALQRRSSAMEAKTEAQNRAEQEAENAPKPKQAEDYLVVDPLEVSIGMGLLSLADPSRGGDLMQRIGQLRNEIAAEVGIILPKVRVRDDAGLDETSYEIRLSGIPILKSNLQADKWLAIDSGNTTGNISGRPAREINPGAKWIEPSDAEQAAIYGYSVRSPVEVLVDHLRDVCAFHADELLTRDATKQLIERLRETSPAVVDELIPDVVRVSDLQQVLQLLLKEAVPIRQLARILELVGDASAKTKSLLALREEVRRGLSRTITSRLVDSNGVLNAVTIDPELEDQLARELVVSQSSVSTDRETEDLSSILPEATDLACEKIREAVKKHMSAGHPPIVLVSPRIRSQLRHWTEASMPWLNVISYDEVTRETQIESHEMVFASLRPTTVPPSTPTQAAA